MVQCYRGSRDWSGRVEEDKRAGAVWGQFCMVGLALGYAAGGRSMNFLGLSECNIRREDFRPAPSVLLIPPTLDSEMGWTGELWSKNNLLPFFSSSLLSLIQQCLVDQQQFSITDFRVNSIFFFFFTFFYLFYCFYLFF